MLGRVLTELVVTGLLLGAILLALLLVVPYPWVVGALAECGLCADSVETVARFVRSVLQLMVPLG